MKRLLTYLVFLCAWNIVSAQQDGLYSQYMFNGLLLNPAYAGSDEMANLSIIGHFQWLGMQDAPRTYTLGLHTASPDEYHGVGLSFIHQRSTVIHNSVLNMNYAFRIPVGKATLALGLLGGLQYYTADFSGVPVHQPGDPSFEGNYVKRLIPTAGTGIYFQSDHLYLGASTPNFLPGRLYNYRLYDLSYAKRLPHYYFTGGCKFRLGNQLVLKPSVLVRWIPGVTKSIDLNMMLAFSERIQAGLSYRISSAMCFLAEFRADARLRIGYAFDYSLGKTSGWGAGSHELRLGWDFGINGGKMESPRVF